MRTSFHHQSEAQPPNGPLTAATSPDTPSTCPARQSVSASAIEGRKRQGSVPFQLSRVPAKGVLNDGVKGQIFKSSRLVVECK